VGLREACGENMKTVIFDIDGTLANIEHRRVYLDGDRPDWARFNATMGEDTPNAPIVDLYKTLWASGAYDLQIVTGRNEAFRKVTETWLTWNEIEFNRVLMRAKAKSWPNSVQRAAISPSRSMTASRLSICGVPMA